MTTKLPVYQLLKSASKVYYHLIVYYNLLKYHRRKAEHRNFVQHPDMYAVQNIWQVGNFNMKILKHFSHPFGGGRVYFGEHITATSVNLQRATADIQALGYTGFQARQVLVVTWHDVSPLLSIFSFPFFPFVSRPKEFLFHNPHHFKLIISRK